MRSDPAKIAAWRSRSKPLHAKTRLTVDPARYDQGRRARNSTLRPVGAAGRRLRPLLNEWRAAVWLRDAARCTAPGAFGLACDGPLDCHHVIPRSVAPQLRLDPHNGTLLCRAHHDALPYHQDGAYALGLLGRRGDRPVDGRARRTTTRCG